MTCLVWTGDNEDDDYFSSFFKKEDTLGDPIREKLASVVDKSSVPLVTWRGRKCPLSWKNTRGPQIITIIILTRISATHFLTCL